MADEIDTKIDKVVSRITELDNLMVRHDVALPSYDFTEQEDNQWKVTCSIPNLEIQETISGGARHEVRELVAEKVLGAVRDKGILNERKPLNG
jgi:hypothetical protein